MTDWSAIFPVTHEWVLTPEQGRRYCTAADDPNPLHHDPELAAQLGLGVVPVPGMLIMGLIAEWTNDLPVVLERLSVRFLHPIGSEQRLVATARVAATHGAAATLRLSVTSGHHLALVGEAVVKPSPTN